jgi:hypothetical protein
MAFFIFSDPMGNAVLLHLLCGVLAVLSASLVNADDPYRYYTWTVTYGTVKLLDVPQQVGNSCCCCCSVILFVIILDLGFS